MKSNILLVALLVFGACSSNNENYLTTTDGNKMYYESYGSADTALVFIHGFSVNSTSWKDQVEFFKDKYQVIVFDLPGFGKSEHKRDVWTMKQYGNDVSSLCRHLKLKKVVLVGWSMGAPVAIEAATYLKGKAIQAVLVDQLFDVNYSLDSTWISNMYNDQADRYKDFEKWLHYFGDTLTTNRYIKSMPADTKIPEYWRPILFATFDWLNHDLKRSTSQLNIPIRPIYASDSEINIPEWKKFYPDYKAIVIENSDHFLVWKHSVKFNEVLLKIISGLD